MGGETKQAEQSGCSLGFNENREIFPVLNPGLEENVMKAFRDSNISIRFPVQRKILNGNGIEAVHEAMVCCGYYISDRLIEDSCIGCPHYGDNKQKQE